jgi:hypothetical protein
LVFVDSPVGTPRRRWVLTQLLGHVKTRFVLIHDALRDAANVYADEQAHGLRLLQVLDSPRGMLLFAVGEPQRPPVVPLPRDMTVKEPRATLALVDAPTHLRPGERCALTIELINTGAEPWSSDFDQPVRLSYHWWRGEAVHTWDGVRTPLPHAVYPGDSCRCLVDVEAPALPGRYRLGVTLLQEEVRWFCEVCPEAITSCEIDVG